MDGSYLDEILQTVVVVAGLGLGLGLPFYVMRRSDGIKYIKKLDQLSREDNETILENGLSNLAYDLKLLRNEAKSFAIPQVWKELAEELVDVYEGIIRRNIDEHFGKLDFNTKIDLYTHMAGFED